MKGFGFIEESRRYYPNGGLLANVLGFVGIDGKGWTGWKSRWKTSCPAA